MSTNKSENSEIAVLQTQMDEVLSRLEQMNNKLDTFATNSRVEELEKKIKEIDRKKALQVWVTGTLSAVFGVILTILVQSFFKTI